MTKDLDPSEFADEAAARARTVMLLAGNATAGFAEAIRAAAASQGRPDPIAGLFDDLAVALDAARAAAAPGDVVLLSPGFTSFGMFLNEFDRGDRFRALVQRLPAR
jgi:UDP-N-acetylmuramoylalanine--D-glutamate ligase